MVKFRNMVAALAVITLLTFVARIHRLRSAVADETEFDDNSIAAQFELDASARQADSRHMSQADLDRFMIAQIEQQAQLHQQQAQNYHDTHQFGPTFDHQQQQQQHSAAMMMNALDFFEHPDHESRFSRMPIFSSSYHNHGPPFHYHGRHHHHHHSGHHHHHHHSGHHHHHHHSSGHHHHHHHHPGHHHHHPSRPSNSPRPSSSPTPSSSVSPSPSNAKYCGCPLDHEKIVCCRTKSGESKPALNSCICKCASGTILNQGVCPPNVEAPPGTTSCKTCSNSYKPICCEDKTAGRNKSLINACQCTCKGNTVLYSGRCKKPTPSPTPSPSQTPPRVCSCAKIDKVVCCHLPDGSSKNAINACKCRCYDGKVLNLGVCPPNAPQSEITCKDCDNHYKPVCCDDNGTHKSLINQCQCTCKGNTVINTGRCKSSHMQIDFNTEQHQLYDAESDHYEIMDQQPNYADEGLIFE